MIRLEACTSDRQEKRKCKKDRPASVHVTQPRMSQIMARNQIAPDIQEAPLNLPATKGKPEIHEKRLRPIAAMLHREDQREGWKQI